MKKYLMFFLILLCACNPSLRLKTETINTMPLNMYMFVEDYKDSQLIIRMSNQSGYPMMYDSNFILQKEKNGEYKEIEEIQFDKVKELQDLEEDTIILSFQTTLDKGKYKIINGDIKTEFELY